MIHMMRQLRATSSSVNPVNPVHLTALPDGRASDTD